MIYCHTALKYKGDNMKDLLIIDSFLDDREFRNYVHGILLKNNFTNVAIEDERLSDRYKINNNDILAIKNGTIYTVQTYLNKELSKKEINETLNDMKKERVENGLIISNKEVAKNIKEAAKKKSIEVWDRTTLLNKIKKATTSQ